MYQHRRPIYDSPSENLRKNCSIVSRHVVNIAVFFLFFFKILDTTDELHVCQLCGSWFEGRKGLSNHARSHLRQIGIPDGEAKGSPIDLLYRIMEEEDLKPITTKEMNQFSLKKSSKRPSGLSSPAASPPAKKSKSSGDCVCILCGEEFESRKGLGSHSRSHLNQLGFVDPLGKTSPIDTIQELVISGVLQAARHPKTAAGLSQAQTQPSSSSASSPATSSPQPLVNKAPKAKKGFRLAVDPLLRKLKPEPVETEVSNQPGGSSSSNLLQKSLAAAVGAKPLDTGKIQSQRFCIVIFTVHSMHKSMQLCFSMCGPVAK